MLLLAVDTSGRNGSLALVRANHPTQAKRGLEWGTQHPSEFGFDVLELVPLAGRMYSAQLIPELKKALARQKLSKTDVDAYVVASGPGSFTGLRVGLSTVKALGEVLRKPIAAVSVLEATARMTKSKGNVVAALDAGRKQAFVGEYDFDEQFNVLRAKESLVAFNDLFASLKNAHSIAFSPDQSIRETAAQHEVEIREVAAPSADIFAYIGYENIKAGQTIPAGTLEANYIRASDAELFSLPKLIQ
jgi:tRNA threonylcarbamoyladenosine biosynthesis protein TsaB